MTPRSDTNSAPLPTVHGTQHRRGTKPGFHSVTAQCAAAAISLLLMASSARALDLADTHWEQAAHAADLDPLMLYAIALTESGRPVEPGQIKPWPWTLNVEGRAHFASSREEAAALLAVNRGKSVDVGLLQVNVRWHGHRVDRLEALLDPVVNLNVGADILTEALASAPGDLTAGIGRYHSSRPKQARSYARTVLSLYRHLLHNEETGGASP